jgi:hypothetical protein
MSDASGDAVGRRLASVDSRWYQITFYGFLLVWLVYLMLQTPSWEWGDKLFPYMIAAPTGIIIAVQLYKLAFPESYERLLPERLRGDEESAVLSQLQERFGGALADELVRDRSQRLGVGARMVGWTVGLVALMWLIGFSNALVIWVFAFTLRFFGDAKQGVLVTVVFFLAVYLFFIYVLGVIPWDGALPVPTILDFLP